MNDFILVHSDYGKKGFGGSFLKNCRMCCARLAKDGNVTAQKTEVSFLFPK